MKKTIHKAESRGHADHGWLRSFHTFSFANYYDPERMHFGVLRVLNDDTVAPGMGFGTHPHENMEIISIPLEGNLEHKDSMGNIHVIREGDVQVMSAGSGITHSEYNHSKDDSVKFLQIWIFPMERNVEPRYQQKTFSKEERSGNLLSVVGPKEESGNAVWIHQNAWLYLGEFVSGDDIDYDLKRDDTGVYVFVLSGQVEVVGEKLTTRDGIGIQDIDSINITAETEASVLLMEVPMR